MWSKWLMVQVLVLWYLAQDSNSSKVFDITKIGMSAMLNNSKIREPFYDCVVSAAPCANPADAYIKEEVLNLFRDYCNRCSDQQAKEYFYGMLWYAQNKPDKLDHFFNVLRKQPRILND